MKLEINTNGAWKTILTGIDEARASEVRPAVAELSRIDSEIHAEAGKKAGKPATWRLVSEGDGRVVGYCNEGYWTPLYHIERGHMPSTSNVEAFSESSDQDDGEHYKRAMNAILQVAARGWRERVALGTALAPRNKAVDPEADVLELHPDLVRASPSARDVLDERRRQVEVEGWTPEHDDQHVDRSLAHTAACYVRQYAERAWVFESLADGESQYRNEALPYEWPESWCESWWKPKSPRRDLVRAAALILAEIERLDRAAAAAMAKEASE